MLVSATALLRANPDPTEEQIRIGLSGNLCRCTGYRGIVRAVRQAASGDVPPLGAAPAHADMPAPRHAG
jgi:carbon-monoxide dehydrogenase small subunit